MNPITSLLHIQYPIIQGGMAHIATHELAAAVSNAGGLGLIAGGAETKETIRERIRLCKQLTNQPFGVNIMLMSPYASDLADVVIEEGVPVVTTGAGNPGPFVPKWKAAGIKVIPVVASVALAKRMERLGVDALICEGMEAGGHIGEITSFALIPQIVDAVAIPVIAAGGIGDARGVLAAFALGAKGIQAGTIFLASVEAPIHDNYKKMIVDAKDIDTIVTGRSTGAPVRVLKNPMAREYVRMEKDQIPLMELEKLTIGSLRRAVSDGDIERGSFMAGQVAGLVKEIRSCEAIIRDLFDPIETLRGNLEVL